MEFKDKEIQRQYDMLLMFQENAEDELSKIQRQIQDLIDNNEQE